jgi:hypothetical protein
MHVRIRYTKTGEESPVEVVTTLANIVAWERRFKRKASEMAKEAGVEDLAYLAWEASKSAKVVVPAVFDDFVNRLESLEITEEVPTNPSSAAPTDEL